MSEKLRRRTDLRIAEKVFEEFCQHSDSVILIDEFRDFIWSELKRISKGVEHGDKLTAVPSGQELSKIEEVIKNGEKITTIPNASRA